MTSLEMAKIAVAALEDKKAHGIRVIKIRDISTIADYLVIADGSNRNQIQAMCKNVEDFLHREGAPMKNREGYANGGWILLDYYDIIIHIFAEEEREFYGLDNIWRDGEILSFGE